MSSCPEVPRTLELKYNFRLNTTENKIQVT